MNERAAHQVPLLAEELFELLPDTGEGVSSLWVCGLREAPLGILVPVRILAVQNGS